MRIRPRYAVPVALVLLVQWIVPAWMIVAHEKGLEEGTEVRLEVAPVDPYDPFRGRYVRINPEPAFAEGVSIPDGMRHGDTVYAVLDQQSDGPARVTGLVRERPPKGTLYIEASVRSPAGRSVDLGISRYYMNEKLAPVAEDLVRDRLRDGAEVIVTLRVLDGTAVVSGLFIDGVPPEELAGKVLQTEP